MTTDEQTAQLAKWMGGKGGMAAFLTVGAVALMYWLLGRKRLPTLYPTGRTRVSKLGENWHRCCTAECAELVRPREILCPKHWVRVPVPIRMLMRKLQTKTVPQPWEWVDAARRAVIFVRDEIARDAEMRIAALGGEA